MKPTDKNFASRTVHSFYFAGRGIRLFLQTPSNAWLHILAAIFASVLGFYFKISETEWFAVIFAIAGVIVAEMLNSALETLVDFVSPEFNELAGKVKDIAAGAVLVAAFAALTVGLIVFLPGIINLLGMKL